MIITTRNKNVITSCFSSPRFIAVGFKLSCVHITKNSSIIVTQEYFFSTSLQYTMFSYLWLDLAVCFQEILEVPFAFYCHPGISHVNTLILIFVIHVSLVEVVDLSHSSLEM